MIRKIIGILICTLLIATAVPAVESQNDKAITATESDTSQSCIRADWNEMQKLLASDGTAGVDFGYSVSLDDNTALIGAAIDDDNGASSGSAYVFTLTGSTWTQQAKLLASDGTANDHFGYSVSVSGDTALIGAAYDDDNGASSGSAYVFTRTGTTWTQQQKLLPLDSAAGDYFGWTVTLAEDTALIGAHVKDSYKGAVYVFIRTGSTWTQQAKLLASDGTDGDGFGYSVSVSGDTDTSLIGAYYDDDNGVDSGSAYVFTRTGTTWTQQAKILALDGATQDWFGWSVSLDNNTALIGAIWDDDNGINAGSAYTFTRTGTTWTQQQKLIALDGAAEDLFGISVSLDGDTALIGARDDDDNGASSGSAYVFTRTGTTWTQRAKLIASDGEAGDYFGYYVSLAGDTALIGAPFDDSNKGSAYVFTKSSGNQPPNPPTITGPAKGKIGVATDYNFTTTDPNDDEVYFFIDWGDTSNSSWIGPYASGDAIIQSHTWNTKGTYTIKAKAKDVYGNESSWGTFSVKMPCSYNIPFQQFLVRFFGRFPNTFPILRHLMGI